MAINHNRVQAAIPITVLQQVQAAFSQLETLLQPYLHPLTSDERVALPKISESNRVFVMESIEALKNNPGFLPTYINPADIEVDITAYNQLDGLVQRAAQLLEKLEDTQMLAGSESYQTSLMGYRMFEAAAVAGLGGADSIYNTLKARFAQGPRAEAKVAQSADPTFRRE